ncbi:glycosyltransferase family A protein [uncultured Sphingomonas sp.]|uniref:glycosyltransferase family A protein n=1 Tax=uncultured Sphingomonas sp. TaxID=158754 RepID=UPI0025DACB11|nr:glycosyltransferase family A protein [uncultured Sphingomonas sp.]
MKYDVVISTLNRAEALKASLLLLEAQSAPPSNIIIVDASDDHEAIKAVVEPAINRDRFNYRWVPSTVKNLPYQRNTGIQYVENEIVFMPDDDSMFYQHSAEEILTAYRLDTEGRVGGVSGHHARSAPGEAILAYKRSGLRAFKELIQPYRNKAEAYIAPKPFTTFAREQWKAQGPFPSFIDGKRFVATETMGGYLMTLRTEVAKTLRFNDVLGYGIGYGLHEDMDIGLRIQRDGKLLVAAVEAPIYHNFFPSKRAAGFNYGFCHIANYAYVCCSVMPKSSKAYQQFARYAQYKLMLYRLAATDDFGKDVLRGARVGWESAKELAAATPETLDDVYRSLCDRFIERKKPA